jgi:Xaa-Pro aminopeptidase
MMEKFLEKFETRLAMNRTAFDAVKKGYARGMSEQAIKGLLLGAWSKPTMEFSGDICADSRIEGDATDYIPQKGDCLILDLQPGWEDCWCDTTRTFFIGAPDEKRRKAYEAVLYALSEMEKVLATHPKACDLYFAMQTALEKYGFSCPHHAGHAVGSEKFLQPQLIAENTTPLEAGMIIALEPGVYFEGEFGIRFENNYLLTQEGIQELFQYPKDINHFIL